GGTLLGILAVTIAGIPLGLAHYSGVVSMPPSLTPTLFQLDFSRLFEWGFVIVVFSILFVDVFDNAGTLIGVTHRTGLMENGKLPRMKEALIADSFAAMFGAVIAAVAMPLTYSIASGIGLGFITYVLTKIISGKLGDLSPAVVVLAVLFAIKFAMPG